MSKSMPLIKKLALIMLVILFTLASTGYITAKNSQSEIEQDIREHVLSKGISGIRFGGERVPPEQIKITSWVEWPFVVVGSYSVPFDLHTSYHRITYLVLPWGRSILSSESFESV